MTILSAQTIRAKNSLWLKKHHPEQALIIRPWEPNSKQALGMSYGLSSCGYDIRAGQIDRLHVSSSSGAHKKLPVGHPAQSYTMKPGEFLLCSSLEYMELPHDVCGKVLDKSTLARQGLALQNTILEPGWRGHITLELSNHSALPIRIRVGQPIGQVVFEFLDQPTDRPYRGKYQDQAAEPVPAILVPDEVDGAPPRALRGAEEGTHGDESGGVQEAVSDVVAKQPRQLCGICQAEVGSQAWEHCITCATYGRV